MAPCTITFSSHYVCITKPTRAIRRLFEVGHYSNEVQRVSLACALWEKRKRTTWLPAHREAERQLCINGRRVHTDTHTQNVSVPLQRIGTFLLLRLLFSSLQKCTSKIWFSGRREEIDQDALGLCEPLDTVFSAIKLCYLL